MLDTGQVTQELYALLIWKFYSEWRDVGWTPQIKDKMKDFWKNVLEFSQC